MDGKTQMYGPMKMVLEACDRRKAGQTVSPYGLTVMKVDY